jgi:catechol 2,3-dioxygenase-like lactoylglutathione lyase family enzyme
VGVDGLDHVQVAAPPGSEDAARGFYGGVVGLEEIPKPEPLRSRGGVWFRAGSAELHVGIDDSFAPARKAHPGLVADDLEALRARLASAGHAVREDDLIEGVRRHHVDDPFGNRLEVRQA